MTNQSSPLHYLSLTQAADLIRTRELSASELTQYILKRIDQLDGTLHAYRTLTADTALQAAEQADKEIEAGNYRGALHGIPLAVKDLCYTQGLATSGGLKVLAEHKPSYDATVVTRLKAAGAILTGKLNLTEGAMIGYHPDFDIPANPWSLETWAGASSSGSGVATAAGLAFASLGSDTGGSIRFPSAACGVVGLKPTWGRVSRYGVIPLAESLDHIGPLTRSTQDAALVLEAIAGYDAHDKTSLQVAAPTINAHIADGISGIRIGIDRKDLESHCDPVVAEAILLNAKVFAELGAEIIEIELPNSDAYTAAWTDLASSESAVAHCATYPSQKDQYGTWFSAWLERGHSLSAVDYARAHHLRLACVGDYKALFNTIDLLLVPSMPTLPPVFEPEDLYGALEAFDFGATHYTAVFDLTGAPTLSMPCGISQTGLPLSLQLVARPQDEALLCRAGHAYESLTRWHQQHPAL